SSRSLPLAREKVFKLARVGERRARAECATLERGHLAAEREARVKVFALKESVDESDVEGVARARRVAAAAGHGHRVRLDERAFMIDDRAALAERHARDCVPPKSRLH